MNVTQTTIPNTNCNRIERRKKWMTQHMENKHRKAHDQDSKKYIICNNLIISFSPVRHCLRIEQSILLSRVVSSPSLLIPNTNNQEHNPRTKTQRLGCPGRKGASRQWRHPQLQCLLHRSDAMIWFHPCCSTTTRNRISEFVQESAQFLIVAGITVHKR